MAAAKKEKKKNTIKGIRGRIPSKKSINLVLVDEKKTNVLKAIPGILAIIVLAVVFGKFLVADRLIAMSEEAAKASQLRSDLESAYQTIKEYGNIEEEYAHYTYAGMTREEMNLVDRAQILDLVDDVLPAKKKAGSWSVSGNILTIETSGNSLEELNKLAQDIEGYPIVDSCTITTANKNEIKNNKTNTKIVWAKLVVYLRQAPEEEEAS